MIGELIDEAVASGLRAGECMEVHVCFADAKIGNAYHVTIEDFRRDWLHGTSGVSWKAIREYANAAWLGIVHEDGAFLVALNAKRSQLPF